MSEHACFVDVYALDKPIDWAAFVRSPFSGAIFKLSQGLHYESAWWAYQQRRELWRSDRYGVDLFDGFYHYLEIGVDGVKQADWFWSLMARIGGEKLGTLWAMLDVERGGQHVELSPQRVADVTGAWATRYEQLSGRKATLYGGELLRAIKAPGLFGCGRSAVALYADELHGRGESTVEFLERTGTSLEHLMLWQYCSTEAPTGPAGWPRKVPGGGDANYDISALVMPGGIAALRSQLWAEAPPP